MRVLVTGADGFVGRHLCDFLQRAGDEVIAWHGPKDEPQGIAVEGARVVDVSSERAVLDAVAAARPDAVVHLAAISSVARSFAEPSMTFRVNTMGTLHLCLAAQRLPAAPRMLIVSSGEVYGPTTSDSGATESDALVPTSPYAASKVAAEVIGFQCSRSVGLPLVCARPFAHIGAGQAPSFAIPSFARQIAQAQRRGEPTAVIEVGNLEPVRDFSHVEDVVSAYRILLERGAPGRAYNVCSGVGRSLQSVLLELGSLCGVAVETRVDPAKLRPVDIPRLVGDAGALRSLGWEPKRTVTDALMEILREYSGTPAG